MEIMEISIIAYRIEKNNLEHPLTTHTQIRLINHG